VLKPELAAVIGGARFLTEIRTTANLQHPHILSLHDSGEVDGTVFYVMPFVEGESLRDRLARETQLPIDDAIRIATEVADALQYAHDHGVIHRDIKPENILLHGGHALVADFGIALAASTTGGARMTETGMSLGTPTYMSPEQAMGERTLDAHRCVRAGCVLYEMLVGDPPFIGSTAQAIVAKVLTEKPHGIIAQRGTHRRRATTPGNARRYGTRWVFARRVVHAASTIPIIPTTATSSAPGMANRSHLPKSSRAPSSTASSAPFVGVIMSINPAPVW
jgi:serine/threonine-protein kinase